jgi:hypothetical protein
VIDAVAPSEEIRIGVFEVRVAVNHDAVDSDRDAVISGAAVIGKAH